MFLRTSLSAAIVLVSLHLVCLPAAGAPFTGGDLVVYRVGTGSANLTTAATAVFLDEFSPSGTLVQSLAMPTAVSGANRRLTAAGNNIGEGQLNLSTDGRFITLTGFDAAVGTASVNTTTSASVNRIVAKVSLDGTIDTSTAYTSIFSQSAGTGSAPCIRSSISTDGSTLWVTGYGTSSPDSSGIRSGQLGQSSTAQVSTTYRNLRNVEIYDGQLFVALASSTGLVKVGTGTPTAAGQTMTVLPGQSGLISAVYGFFMADLNPELGYAGTTLDTVFVADDGTNTVTKLSFDGTNFTYAGGLPMSDPRGLTGRVLSDGQVELFAVLDNGDSNDTIVRIIDESGYGGRLEDDPLTTTDDSVIIATALTRTAFRGIDFIPEPAGTCWLLAMAGLTLLRRTRAA
jgi:hypothetical protein